jgi:GTP:adenosylcobinamide-phosphate guanylyltransferase
VTPAGINVVDDGDDEVWVRRDPKYAVNVNQRSDARRAEWWLASR